MIRPSSQTKVPIRFFQPDPLTPPPPLVFLKLPHNDAVSGGCVQSAREIHVQYSQESVMTAPLEDGFYIWPTRSKGAMLHEKWVNKP